MEDTSLQAKVSRLFKGEPAKSAEKLGFEDSSGELTSSGEEVFIEWLYKKAKNGELAEADFAKDIIYPLRDEDKKEKKKK